MTLDVAANVPPLVAILRGIRPAEVAGVTAALTRAGIRIIEVPQNAPDALASLRELAAAAGEDVLVGAGTVLEPSAVDDVAGAGARFIVAPNTDLAVIARALACGLDPLPGVMTPSEAFAALGAGARHLKLFPAASLGPGYLRALGEVLPGAARVWAVGGVSTENLGGWLDAGAFGAALGSALYRPGRGPEDVHHRAAALVARWRDLKRG